MPRKKSGVFDQSKYIQEFIKENVVTKKVVFNRTNDAELLEKISKVKNFSGYVKSLIRQDTGIK